MVAKKKAAPKKKVVKKHAVKKKVTPKKKSAGTGKQSASAPKSDKTPATRNKAAATTGKNKAAKRLAAKGSVKKAPTKKVRARTRKLGPVPKYHINHQSWDKIEVMEVICDRLMSDSKGIAYVCRDDDELPTIAIVYKWFSDENTDGGEKPLLDMYARAKQLQIDYLADEIVEISDNECSEPICIDGVPVLIDKKPIYQTSSASVQKAKLRCDNRKWLAEKLAHRKYGNKLEVSGDPERPLSSMTDDDLDARILLLKEKIAKNGINPS